MQIPLGPILTPAIQTVQQRHLSRLERLYAGSQPDTLFALDGLTYGSSHHLSGCNDINMLADPRGWLADVLADMACQADRLADEVTFRPPVIGLDPYGVHIVDALFGAPVRFHGGQVWSEELEIDLADLECPDLAHSPLFQQIVRLAELAVEFARAAAGDGRIFIATPVFACAINVGINLFGERLLEAMHTRQEAARHALAVVNETIMAATRAVNAIIPPDIRRNSVAENRLAPAGVGQLDGCSTQLISRRDYSRFVAPLDEAFMQSAPRGMLMHLCGAHAQHIPTWQAMAGLRAVQLNDRAMDDLPAYFNGLRSDTVFYLCPSERVPLETILEITGGQRVILQASLERAIPVRGA